MLESLLIADVGVGASRVVEGCRRLGVKSVAVRLSHPPDDGLDGQGQPVGASDRFADDVVLLADLSELRDAGAVLRAAEAAGVSGVHPGRGSLRTSVAWADDVRAASLVPVVSSGSGFGRPGTYPAGTVEVTFVVDDTGCVELGTVERAAGVLRSPAVGDQRRAGQLARAAVAEHDVRGLVSVAVLDGVVVGLEGGLPIGQTALELSAGIDLLAIQLNHAAGEPLAELAGSPPPLPVAITRSRLDVVNDLRTLAALDPTAVRLDVTALHPRGHEGVVWASAVGVNEAAAATALESYVTLLPVWDA